MVLESNEFYSCNNSVICCCCIGDLLWILALQVSQHATLYIFKHSFTKSYLKPSLSKISNKKHLESVVTGEANDKRRSGHLVYKHIQTKRQYRLQKYKINKTNTGTYIKRFILKETSQLRFKNSLPPTSQWLALEFKKTKQRFDVLELGNFLG